MVRATFGDVQPLQGSLVYRYPEVQLPVRKGEAPPCLAVYPQRVASDGIPSKHEANVPGEGAARLRMVEPGLDDHAPGRYGSRGVVVHVHHAFVEQRAISRSEDALPLLGQGD